MEVVIDRFEGQMAVCEKPDRTMLNIPGASCRPEPEKGMCWSSKGIISGSMPRPPPDAAGQPKS